MMINEIADLFREDLVFVEEATNKEEIFNIIGARLIEQGLVKDNFIQELLNRENNYPTGLDLSIVDQAPFNIAVPHTEREYCNCKQIVVVKLIHEIILANMISPADQLKVKYLFIMLNNDEDAQVNLLANIMDFVTKESTLAALEKYDTPKEIYNFIAH